MYVSNVPLAAREVWQGGCEVPRWGRRRMLFAMLRVMSECLSSDFVSPLNDVMHVQYEY